MSKISVSGANQIPEPDLEPPVFEDDGLAVPGGGPNRRIVASEEEVAAVEAAAEEEKPEVVTELTDEERGLFRSLLTIGRRIKTISVMDHEVVLQTMSNADEMRVGLATKEYEGSRGFVRAYQAAIVASTIVTLEGTPLYTPLSEKEDATAIFDKKFKKVLDMYPIVTSQIYNEVLKMEAEFVELSQKLGKIPG